MKIKIIAIATALFILTPLNNVFAEEDIEKSLIHDYVDFVDITTNLMLSDVNLKRAYDRDLNTFVLFNGNGQYLKFTFKKPVNVKKVFMKYTGSEYRKTRIITTESEVIELDGLWQNGTNDVNYENVISIEIYNHQGYYELKLYEIDFFGEVIEPTPIEEVQEVNIQTKYNRVDLSWQLPQTEDFHHVAIYRKTIKELKEIQSASLLDKMFGANKVYASEVTEYDPLFETNGTYFNDLTVKPRSEYSYKLTTVTTDGKESPGIIVTAETPDEPNPQIVGGGYTETAEGDYLFKWTSPTEGQVKIIVGGKEYKTVNASDKQILIPKEDMVYAFDKPDVSLIPISPYGKEGNEFSSHPIKQIKIPFGANDLLKTGVSLLWVLGPFVLLAMAFLLVPKFRKTIVDAFNKKSENKRVSV